MVKYSICVSHFNNAGTIEKSLGSILNQIDDDYEIVIVDNLSNDGSERILQNYEESGKIQLIKAKSTRGRARQIAFENSRGDYIIAHMDMDDLFAPNLKSLCKEYHDKYEGLVLRVERSPYHGIDHYTSITIAPRSVISHLGGWNDLDWYEDGDLWLRANEEGKLVKIFFPILSERGKHPERCTLLGRITHRYTVYRSALLIGSRASTVRPQNRKQTMIYLIAKTEVYLRRLKKRLLEHRGKNL